MSNREIIYAAAGTGESYWIDQTGSGGTTYQDYYAGRNRFIDSTKNIYVGGTTSESGQGLEDVFVNKLTSTGPSSWQRTIGKSAQDDRGYGACVDSTGNFISIGYDYTNGINTLFKYNSSGTLQWQRKLTGTGIFLNSVATDSSDNIYVSGTYTDTNTVQALLKYDSSGTLQWQRKLSDTGGLNSSMRIAVTVDASGNPYVVSGPADGGYVRLVVVKYNSSGTLQWQRKLSSTASNLVYATVVASSDVYIYCWGDTDNKTYVIKYNTSGTIQWQRSISVTGDTPTSIAIDCDANNVYVAGYVGVVANVMKYNSSGTLQWQRSLAYTGTSAYGYSVAVKEPFFVVQGERQGGASYYIFSAKLPTSGGLTGTYGSWVYAATSYTDAASSLTDAAGALTDAAGGLTDAAGDWTSASASLTVSTTTVP